MNYGSSDSGELAEVGGIAVNPNGEIVETVSGGWISGSCLPEDLPEPTYTGLPYGMNIVRLMADYPEFVILGERNGDGWRAYQRGARSRAIGEGVHGSSLDELAERMNAIRRHIDGV
ncbi:MAG TPA: hypothetical protein VFV41_17345 [Streptosporangiaceae bacterium]|nr:hypothetical protein [Streptosporangiaceae bacterium]